MTRRGETSGGKHGLSVGEQSAKMLIHSAAVDALAAAAVTGIETYLLAPVINNRAD